MTKPIISVEHISKRYLIGHQNVRREGRLSLQESITREVRNFGRKAADLLHGQQVIQGDEVEEFWALRDVSFDVKQGDVIGIIGRNGAGKSTLLKILSRITEPTSGEIILRGRVASLLEVGTGFHPDLTGRENIFLNGAILGMSRREIRKKFDEIVAFAGIDRFLDTPVKRYSSGMYVRLAFSVAAHLEPEILIIDEVLAVGDAEFQKKCLGKAGEVSRNDGRTVLFVSHNMAAISSLCPSAIWMDNGQIRHSGLSRDVINDYLNNDASKREMVIDLDRKERMRGKSDRLRLKSLEWQSVLPLQHGEKAKARITFETSAPLIDLTIRLGFSGLDGRRLLTYESDFQDNYRPSLLAAGKYSVDIEIDSLPLAPGVYTIDVGCRSGESHSLDYIGSAAQVEIISGPATPNSIIENNVSVRLESNWSWQF
jgi:lipopolysaccharide transport system ATP-binding protein